MKYGKKVCELLKDIRKQIADDNGIEYTPISCDHEGDCPGTCPQCDKELKELQEILDKKESCNEPIVINKRESCNEPIIINNRGENLFYEFERPRVLGGQPVVPTEHTEENFSDDYWY